MEPAFRSAKEGFGGVAYQDVTNIHPIAIAAVLILGIAMLVLPRRLSVLPMLIIACFISSVQKIVILGLDFNLLRIMVLFGVVRVLCHKEYDILQRKPLDVAIAAWTIISMIFYVLQQGSMASIVFRLGLAFDAFGMYFLFRCLVRDWQDLDQIIMAFIVISIPVAFFFFMEKSTGRNMFSMFGGVPAITIIREGRLRCQGAFSHPIIAGCFWATLIPLFVGYGWKSVKGRGYAVIGILAVLFIVLCSSSSTPVLGVLAGITGCIFFYLRYHMRKIRWMILFALIALHMVMNAPVWHLVSRISAVGGSTGYFRYMLIDSAIRRFSEWALVGTKSTGHWFWGAQDIPNQYVLEGVRGGFLSLCAFIAVIVVAFREIGKLWRLQTNSRLLLMSWMLGVSLFVHCMCFIGVSYFGQIWILWYLLLAIIGSLSVPSDVISLPQNYVSTSIIKEKRNKSVYSSRAQHVC